jgi:hypothetical protein
MASYVLKNLQVRIGDIVIRAAKKNQNLKNFQVRSGGLKSGVK